MAEQENMDPLDERMAADNLRWGTRLAIASLLLGLLPWVATALGLVSRQDSKTNLVLCGMFFLVAPLIAAILGCATLQMIREAGGGMGRSIAAVSGIVLGIFTFALVLLGVLTINQPFVPDDSESSAIGIMREIGEAQQSFHAARGQYATSFDQLTTATPPFLDSNWETRKGTYDFVLSGDGAHFRLNANPTNSAKTDVRHFYTDETGVIRQNNVVSAGRFDRRID